MISYFCYDEQNRLISASANGTVSCGSFTAGTLNSAQYQQSYTYDTNGRLTTSSQGSYTYSDNSHLHAITATGSGYSAAYDAAGNMTCRAPSSATTCSGTQTGQQLSYDAEGNLSTSLPISSLLYGNARGNYISKKRHWEQFVWLKEPLPTGENRALFKSSVIALVSCFLFGFIPIILGMLINWPLISWIGISGLLSGCIWSVVILFPLLFSIAKRARESTGQVGYAGEASKRFITSLSTLQKLINMLSFSSRSHLCLQAW